MKCALLQSRMQAPAWLLCLGFGLFTACSSASGVLTGETAFVVPEKARVRSSTAEAARAVGEVKSGDQVTITERKNEGNTTWANISGPNGVTGWLETRFLVKQDIAQAAQKIAAEIRDVPTQAVGKSKARLKLRLTPDRNDDSNVAFELPAGATLDIVARERKPRPEKLVAQQAQAASKDSGKDSGKADVNAGPKFDDWYKVRLKNLAIVPAGWIYGGSVELDIPGDIAFFASTGRRITGWQAIGSTQDEQNQTKEHYLVVEKQLYDADERLDFDRLKVLAFDPKRREYYTPFRDEISGRFPLRVKTEGKHGSFEVAALDKAGQAHSVDYSFEFVESGHPKVTRVTPGGAKKSERQR